MTWGENIGSQPCTRVKEINFKTDERWEQFLRAHPNASIYMHPGWLQAMEREYGQSCLSLVCEDEHGLATGILPLFFTTGVPFNLGPRRLVRRLSSLPRTPIAGPLTLNEAATTALVRAAMKKVEEKPGFYLEIKTQSHNLSELVPELTCVPWRLSYIHEIESVNRIHFGDARNHARIKWAVHKAVKLGLEVRNAETEDDLRLWYELYLRTMRAKCVPARPYRFFAALWARLKPRGFMQLLLAERYESRRRKLIAGSVFFLYGRTVSYAYSASSEEDLWLRPNDLLQWTAVDECAKSGFETYDLGEVPEWHQQLADFKRKWGTRTKRLYHYYYPAPPIGTVDPPRSGFPWFVAHLIWPRLPLGVSSWLGDQIYSHL